MNVEPLPRIPDSDLPVSRAYSGSYEECRAAMERDAADLAPMGYHVLSESYGVTWGAGACIGWLSVEFGRAAPVATGSGDDDEKTAGP
jgi:hypothetical protein